MNSSRITQRMMAQGSLQGLQGNLGRLGRLQEQLSSGRTINRPSDSPTGTVEAMAHRSTIRALEQHARNAQDGAGWLGTIDSTLTGMLDAVRRVRDLTLQGASTGSASAASREAMAAEVAAIRESLLAQANTTYLGRPVFGGIVTGDGAYDTQGTYVGSAAPTTDAPLAPPAVVRTVGANTQVRVDLTGTEAFGAGDAALFAVVDRIATALRGAPTELTGLLDELDAVREGMQTALSGVGARSVRVQQARQVAQDGLISARGALAEVESVDVPATIVELQLAEMSYQAALGATSRVLQPTLVDWLR
jgi:flagellar hook-associated protein 3 FlgL